MSLRKTFYQTTFTPVPSHIPRQLAIDLLHNHSEIIELNPLVIGHQPCAAPPKAPADEYYSTWYEIQQRIQFIPGTGKVGSGKISFNGVFHNLPNGLQTHIYAAAGTDLRHSYSIGGNQPGETPEPKELGSGAPSSGLYLREDVEIKSNMVMISFVKKELRSATDILIARLVKKAELIDAGILHAMMEDGKLKTINPANRISTIPGPSPALSSGFPGSNRNSTIHTSSPRFPNEGSQISELQGSDTNARQSQYGQPQAFVAELQDTGTNTRQYQYGQPPTPRGLGVELPDNISVPLSSQTFSQQSRSQPSTDRASYHEVSGESVISHHELPVEQDAQKWKSNDRLSHRYYGSERIAQVARTSSWTADDDKKL